MAWLMIRLLLERVRAWLWPSQEWWTTDNGDGDELGYHSVRLL